MSKSNKVPTGQLDLKDYEADLGDDFGRELELYFPAIVEILLPQIFQSINDLPKTLQPFVRKLKKHRGLLKGEIETDAENILAKRIFVKIILDHLVLEYNRIHGPTKEIVRAIIETRQELADIKHNPFEPLNRLQVMGRRLDNLRTEYEQKPRKKNKISLVINSIRNQAIAKTRQIIAQEVDEKETLGQNKIHFCIAQLEASIKNIPISDEEPADFNYVSFFDLPYKIQYKLLFDPFEAIAAQDGILPQEAMESPMNRIAMVYALNLLLGLNMTQRSLFYIDVITAQRNNTSTKDINHQLTWSKCLKDEIKKPTNSNLAIYRYSVPEDIDGQKS